MTSLKRRTVDGDAGGHDDVVSMRQVIAYNLARARRERNMTQDQLGAVLVELTGKEWSRATISAAESGWDSQAVQRRVRHFEVNDVAAFAIALRLPIIWFFLPPPTTPSGAPLLDRYDGWITIHKDAEQAGAAMSSQLLLRLVFTQRDEDDADDLMGRRLHREKLTASMPSTDSIILRRLKSIERLLTEITKSES